MEIIETTDFKKGLERLPTSIKRLYHTQHVRFVTDSRDPRLHTKKLQGLDDVYSIRVTRNYRALFYFHTENTVIFFAIGDRKEIYQGL